MLYSNRIVEVLRDLVSLRFSKVPLNQQYIRKGFQHNYGF
jgi:hypothetical protein